MSIERQYSLPNCTLILFGWSEASDSVMSMLANVECQIAGVKLTGGREFFESLAQAVNYYAQEMLSGVHCPPEHVPGPQGVRLEKLGDRTHQLSIQPVRESTSPNPTEVKLTDVQLFDLVEAIDQFFADGQTLPDLSWSLTPTSKRYVQSAIPMAQRATPVALGTAGVAFAAGLFFIMPVPTIERPAELEEIQREDSAPDYPPNSSTGDRSTGPQGTNANTSLAVSESTPESSDSPLVSQGLKRSSPSSLEEPEDLDNLIERAPSITDPTEISILNRRLHEDIDRAWQNRDELDKDLAYRVAVAEDGAILGYKANAEDTNPQDIQLTPLLELVYIPTAEGGTEEESIAEFKVVFREQGFVEVSPWNGFPPGSQSLGLEITDPFLLENLNQELYSQINAARIPQSDYPVELDYRVAVERDGEIIDYEALNQAAFDYLDRTPLPSLLQLNQDNRSEDRPLSDRPLAQFKVVFTPEGVLQVSPWRGYSP